MKPIFKHNKLIEASYKINSREQFFILYLISQISQSDNRFKEYSMSYSEIERIINFDGKRRIANRSEVFRLMDKLNEVPIVYEHGSIVGKSVWFQYMEHNKETDEFTFSLSEKLRGYLLQLREHFTKYNLKNIIYLTSNAIRLYEVLKRHQFKGECLLKVEEIKFYLGLEHQYDKYYDFKRYVIQSAQSEIKKYTDISFDFEPASKIGKRVVSLRFKIKDNIPEETLPEHLIEQISDKWNPGSDLIESLPRAKFIAYQMLIQKGVGGKFVLQDLLPHRKVNYEPLLGYEDVYIKQLWKHFLLKTKSSNKPATFVSWWRKGYLTEDQVHTKLLEEVLSLKKTMTEEERDNRDRAKDIPAGEYKNI